MNCDQAFELAPLYLCGELDPALIPAFEGHLRVCAGCAEELREMRSLDETLRDAALADPATAEEIDNRVRLSIKTEVAADLATHRVRRRRWAAAAMGLAAIFVLGFFAFGLSSGRSRVLAAAAQDHQREVIEGAPRRWMRDSGEIAALVEENGFAAQTVSALAPAGYHLERAKRCPLDGRIFVHLVYTDGLREFSVFLRPAPSTAAGSVLWRVEAAQGISSADFGADHADCFASRGITAVVVTGDSRESASSLARFVRTIL